MAVNKRIIRLSFGAENGATMSLTLDNPKEDITSAEVEEAMDAVIAGNIFHTSGGDLVTKKDAKIIDTVTQDMYDPA